MFNPELIISIDKARTLAIADTRKPILDLLITYCKSQIEAQQPLRLNFICTHNSRRSQFSQIWAQIAASYYHIPAQMYSGGVEVTAFNERAVASVKRAGLTIDSSGQENPTFKLRFDNAQSPIVAFSKHYDHVSNPTSGFAAIMTCSDADDNCPFIPGADSRIPLRYEDPKAFDNTPLEKAKYDERSIQIASEMFYVFGRLNK